MISAKRPFLLIEVLAALFIVMLCLIPLLKSPILWLQYTQRSLEEIEGERLANWTFSEVEEMLLRRQIRWDALPGPGQKEVSFPLPPATIRVGEREMQVRRSVRLYCSKRRGEKRGKDGAIYRNYLVRIDFDPKLSRSKKKSPYVYRIIMKNA
ncbi:MAG: hypothetical protein RL235_325 [Chlamydiota bacterium]|jgi:hypothetical protein